MATLTNISKNTATLGNIVKNLIESFLLLETGGYLLLETGDRIILEQSVAGYITLTNITKSSATLTNITKS